MKVFFKYPREIDGKLYKPGEHNVDVSALSAGGKWYFKGLSECGDIGKPVPAALKKAQDVANRLPDYPLAGDGVNLAHLNALKGEPTEDDLEESLQDIPDEVSGYKLESEDENFDGEHDEEEIEEESDELPADNAVITPGPALTKKERKALERAQRGK